MRKSFNVRNSLTGNTKWSESNQSNGDCRFIIFRAVAFFFYIFLHNVLRFDALLTRFAVETGEKKFHLRQGDAIKTDDHQ